MVLAAYQGDLEMYVNLTRHLTNHSVGGAAAAAVHWPVHVPNHVALPLQIVSWRHPLELRAACSVETGWPRALT